MTFRQIELALDTLTVFRPIAKTPVVASFQRICGSISEKDAARAADNYAEVCYLLKQAGASGIGAYLSVQLKYEQTNYAKALRLGLVDPEQDAAAKRDIQILSEAALLPCSEIKRELIRLSDGRFDEIVDSLPEWETGTALNFDALIDFYRQNGFGILAKHRAFLWSGDRMTPVKSPDLIRYEQMIGYDWQRRAVLENTRALISGKAVNNILLYGDSGTGKSATVKSMLGIETFNKLTLIEVSKRCLNGLPALMEDLSWRPQKFILFIDDLSFEDADAGYSALKVILEGSLFRRPENIVIYATSNRRQLTRRLFSERDEINGTETVEEKTSLADRFGIRIPFFSLNRQDYLETAEALARQAGIETESEALKKAALQWEMEHGSRTPRTARQFADHLAAGLLP